MRDILTSMAFSSEFEGTAKRRKCTTLNTMEADVTADTLPLYRTDRKLCPHCGEVVALKTFKLHKRLYYDQVCIY